MPERHAAEGRAAILAKDQDHVVTVRPAAKRIKVLAGEKVIADTERALELDESNHQPVYYLPHADVCMDTLTSTEKKTYCPFKGTASYWSIETEKGVIENAVWSYEDPLPEVTEIAGHLAFYLDKVEEIRLSEL